MTQAAEKTNLVNLTIDGKAVSVPKGTTVYHAARTLKIDVPIFCYQDRMPPFGACRVCLVEVEKMPKLQASCTLEATEGMVVHTQSQNAVKGREGILELLLINHPLDCPICDKGGECPLQDQTLKHGPGLSRFVEEKRHFDKPIPLGPVLMLDRERCIVCARCTRFGDVVAGDHALEFIDRGFKTEVGTPDGGPVESKFIGNTISICPVGALTSRVYRFRARPWDNVKTPSTCTLCPVGCSMTLESRDGAMMRTQSYENREVNDIWLCDKGWFGYEFTNHTDRLTQPLIRKNGYLEPVGWDEALSLVATKFKEAIHYGKMAGWGGNPLTVKENYLFQKLFREGAGISHLDHRIGMPIFSLDEEGLPLGMEISIGDCEQLKSVLLLGLDLTEEFPVVWLRLKQAINKGTQVRFFGHYAPEIAKYLTQTLLHAPGQELEILKKHLFANEAIKDPVIFIGSQYLASPQRHEILAELIKYRQSHPGTKINVMEGRGNSFGARFAGMHPELGPRHQRLQSPGMSAAHVLQTAASGIWDFLYVAGANPVKMFPPKLWKEARNKLGFLVVQDIFLTETAQQANVVLPTLTYIEKKGSFINIEGRVQKLQPGKDCPQGVYSDEEIFEMLGERLGVKLDLDKDFAEALEKKKVHLDRPERISAHPTPSPSQQEEGALRVSFSTLLFDQGVRMKHNPHVSRIAKEPMVRLHPAEAAKRGLVAGGFVRVMVNGSSLFSKLCVDGGVAEGTIVIPMGFESLPVHDLGLNLLNGIEVHIKKEE